MSGMYTKERIRNSMLKLLIVNGYHNTRTREIAENAGVSESTLFRYYNNKYELFKDVIEEQASLFGNSSNERTKSLITKYTGKSDICLPQLMKLVIADRIELLFDYKYFVILVLKERYSYIILNDIFYSHIYASFSKIISFVSEKAVLKGEMNNIIGSEMYINSVLGAAISNILFTDKKELLNSSVVADIIVDSIV